MSDGNGRHLDSAEKTVRDIRRATRRKFSAEEKIGIVLEGLRGEETIAELCRREGIAESLYYKWSQDFFGGSQECTDTVCHRSSRTAWSTPHLWGSVRASFLFR